MSSPANDSAATASSSVSHAEGGKHHSRSEMAAAVAALPRTVTPGTAQAEAIAQARALNAAWAAALPSLLKPEPDNKRPALLYSDVAGVWETFTASLPPEVRSLWLPCRRCNTWLSSFGHIVVLRDAANAAEKQQETSSSTSAESAAVSSVGPPRVIPLFWNESVEALAPPVFSPAIRAVRALFAGGAETPVALTGAFIPVLEVQPGSSNKAGRTLGVEVNSVEPPGAASSSASAESKEGEAAAVALASLALEKPASSTRTYWHACFTFPASACQETDDAHAYSTYAEMLTKALQENSMATIRTVHEWLMQSQIEYADQHKPAIDMLFKLKQRYDPLTPEQRELVLWQTLCGRTSGAAGMISSVRTGMVSTLLADAYAETPFEEVQRKWNVRANPTTYMRATEAPSAGNVAAAERLFAELGITHKDLERRFLLRTEVPKRALAWQRQPPIKEQPAAQLGVVAPGEAAASSSSSSSSSAASSSSSSSKSSGGLFSNVKTKPAAGAGSNKGVARCNFLSFLSRPELAAAVKVEFDLPATINAVMFVTGLPGSVPLMQWHTEQNLASSYSYSQLRDVGLFGLKAGWVEVHSILSFPHQWDDDTTARPLVQHHAQHGRRYLLALEGLTEQVAPTGTLFAAYMQSRFHGVRSTIEAHNQVATVSGKETMGAEGVAGWMVDVNQKPEAAAVIRVRVTDAQGKQTVFELTSEGESDATPKEPAAAEGHAAAAPGGVAVAEGK